MKLKTITVNNFASYDTLTFDFDDLGLSLIHGETGSGKSTIMDMPIWALYGRTGKDGNVDEIRSWTNPDASTSAVIDVDTPTGSILISRIRGKQHENDLYYQEELESGLSEPIRGKDLTETQKLIDHRLGVSYQKFANSTIFNEFSSGGAFFTAKSKERKELFESIADLSLPIKLHTACKLKLKDLSLKLNHKERDVVGIKSTIEAVNESITLATDESDLWDDRHQRRLTDYQAKIDLFEKTVQQRIKEHQIKCVEFESNRSEMTHSITSKINTYETKLSLLNNVCDKCAQPVKEHSNLSKELASLQNELSKLIEKENPHTSALKNSMSLVDPYSELLKDEQKASNPFLQQLNQLNSNLDQYCLKYTTLKAERNEAQMQVLFHEQLKDLSSELRMELLQKTVNRVENQINLYLNDYFDAYLKVKFELEAGDSLNIEIQKDGYNCVYRQLSKGQRQLLRLTFALSVMEVSANNAGTHFNCLMFDEVLDALDDKLKAKAYYLFEELSLQHSTVLLIDHDESLKNLFTNGFHVTMESDTSKVVKDDEPSNDSERAQSS